MVRATYLLLPLSLSLAACQSPSAPSVDATAGRAVASESIPLNLDFSRPGLVTPEWPWGWFLPPLIWAGVEIDLIEAEAGHKELRLDRAEDGEAARAIYFLDRLPGTGGGGKDHDLAIGGRVRILEGSRAAVRLGLVVFAGDETPFETWSDVATTGAASLDAALTIPAGRADRVESVQIVVEYAGAGTAAVLPLRLTVDGELLAGELPGQEPPAEAEVVWVRRHAIPLETTDPEAPLDDLAPLATVIGDAPLVLLGESTHGSREFFTLRHRVIRWLAREHGFTVLALEDHAGAALAVDRFVQTGEGDAAVAVEKLFGVWERQEMVDLVLWLRSAVAAGEIRMAVRGVDLQNPLDAIAALEAFATEHDPELVAELDDALGAHRAAWRETSYPQREPEEHRRWAEGARRLLERMEERASLHRRRAGDEAAAEALQNARLAWQSAELARAGGDLRLRDRFMAENLVWLRSRQPAGTRIVGWAHNFHVRLDEGAMGDHLARRYPGEIVSVGFFTQRGEYAAYDGSEMRVYPLFPGPPGSVERLLHETGHPIFALDLRPARAAAAATRLRTPHYHRNVGLYPADLGFYPAALTEGFHALFFVDRTTATRPIGS